MKYPVNYIGITQGFHQGKSIDFGWNSKYGGKNQPIFACDSGQVYKVEVQNKGGNVVYIEHDNGFTSCYAHLDNNGIKVKTGDYVKLGQEIGLMGTTGSSSTGNHLHFSIHENKYDIYKDSTINPFDYLEVYDEQIVSESTKKNYPIKYHNYNETKIKYVYNVDYEGLNVRSDASLSASIVDILPVSTKVEVTEEKNNFSKIGNNKWVYSKYLSDSIPEFKTVAELKSPPLNVRRGPSTKYKIIDTINPGTKVQVYENKNGWSKISYNEAWVSSNYLI